MLESYSLLKRHLETRERNKTNAREEKKYIPAKKKTIRPPRAILRPPGTGTAESGNWISGEKFLIECSN